MDPQLAPDYVTALYRVASRHTGWLKFLGVLLILGGIPTAIILIGIVYIWLGIKLFQAASALETRGEEGLLTFVENVCTYFKVYGILVVVGLILGIVFATIGIYGALGILDSGMFA